MSSNKTVEPSTTAKIRDGPPSIKTTVRTNGGRGRATAGQHQRLFASRRIFRVTCRSRHELGVALLQRRQRTDDQRCAEHLDRLKVELLQGIRRRQEVLLRRPKVCADGNAARLEQVLLHWWGGGVQSQAAGGSQSRWIVAGTYVRIQVGWHCLALLLATKRGD